MLSYSYCLEWQKELAIYTGKETSCLISRLTVSVNGKPCNKEKFALVINSVGLNVLKIISVKKRIR